MALLSSYLKKIHKREEASLNSYILYDLNRGIYAVDVDHYADFLLLWVGLKNPPSLTMDLAFASPHSVVFDFDCLEVSSRNYDVFDIIFALLKRILLPTFPHFTYLVCTRRGGRGVHVHLPEFKIGHDDYIFLCKQFQRQFGQVRTDYKLDILANAMLSGAAKPNTNPYVPARLVYADENHTATLDMTKWKDQIEGLKTSFPKRKSNEGSLFRILLNSNYTLLLTELKQLMMPVALLSTYALSYPTTIGKNIAVDPHSETVAQFLLQHSADIWSIVKSTTPQNAPPLKTYHYLKLNARNMVQCQTDNHAIKMWFERFHESDAMDNSHIPLLFRDIHGLLQHEHTTLAENPNPLKTIMQFHDRYYFLPVFYALCQYYDKDSRFMAEQLRDLLDVESHPLLDKLAAISPRNIQYAVEGLTLNTIHFCANNLNPTPPKTYREKLKSIVDNNHRAILSVTTHKQMVDFIRNLQERHLPIRVLKMKNALKKPTRHIWNALSDSWQEINATGEVSDHITNLWSYVKQFMHEYTASGGRGGPEKQLIQKFSVPAIVAAIMSDTAMELKDIQMDTHKWFLRFPDGVLDLLTGHIGGVVPEYFISNRTIDLGIPRPLMMKLSLETLYETLTDLKFSFRFCRTLLQGEGDTLFNTLQSLLDGEVDDLSASMMHFYVNLCKCTCFDYQLMMYLLDVLASVLIGTNYERKFFVFKGQTRNGKSKLFEVMGRALGGYYHSIQSENLAPSNNTNTATPELASTLFSCRMVTCEELEKKIDENRVKQITGNSFVTFRNMYEQNTGGIPIAKVFATTNNYPECKASLAFKDRVVAIPFDAEFTNDAPSATAEQVAQNKFPIEAYVVEQSYRGCFLMLYYHLLKHLDPDDALLHYRPEPESVKEFTHEYLIHTDVYVQFKIHMDIQLMPGYMTSLNEVKSAIRQYLKTTKNTSTHEEDLMSYFVEEFHELRKQDVHLGDGGFASVLDEPKKMKYDATVVFYEGVVIKNLKRASLDS